jgi:hypothetical protein
MIMVLVKLLMIGRKIMGDIIWEMDMGEVLIF